MKPSKLLIVDDHRIIQYGLESLLSGSDNYTIVGSLSVAKDVLPSLSELAPDIIILDLCIGGRDGLELLSDIVNAQPHIKVLVFTSMKECLYGRKCIELGAKGFLNKSEPPGSLLTALDKLREGYLHMSLELQTQVVKHTYQKPKNTGIGALSDGELRVFTRIGAGQKSTEIARDLGLSMKTISSYKEKIKNKLNLSSSYEIEVKAKELQTQEDAR